MRFLLHGQVGDGVAQALRGLGHLAARLPEVGLPEEATPAQVLEFCRTRQHELLTASRELVDAALPAGGRPAVFGRVIVYLQDQPAGHELAVHRLFGRYKRLSRARLYTVTGGRVKVRQLPTGPVPASRS